MQRETGASTETDVPTLDNGSKPTTSTATAPANDGEESINTAFTYKYNCNQIRAKVRTFLGTKELTLSETGFVLPIHEL
ncbi:hypothetical protein PI125_g3559 [Phytophthora idaei]|nr:hypothetical protein PI125_g3559 [Phytophthora idaei]KAG3158820.1 hypothetical protein PI126_g7668 [Phytophthora idaei]